MLKLRNFFLNKCTNLCIRQFLAIGFRKTAKELLPDMTKLEICKDFRMVKYRFGRRRSGTFILNLPTLPILCSRKKILVQHINYKREISPSTKIFPGWKAGSKKLNPYSILYLVSPWEADTLLLICVIMMINKEHQHRNYTETFC